MKKILIFISLHCFFVIFGQSTDKNYLSNRYSIERMGTVGQASVAVLPGMAASTPDIIGDQFLKSNFGLTTAIMYNNQVLDQVNLKYDLLHNDFYIQSKQGLRVLSGEHVKSYTLIDSITKKESMFINAKEFKSGNGTAYLGFYEILIDGKMALLKKTTAKIVKANYNATLNVGKRDHQIKKEIEYQYLSNDVVLQLPTTKSLTSIFGDSKALMDKYIKVNQLNLKDERHLKLVFEHFNSLN